MRAKFGTALILLGMALLAGALGLYLHNDREDQAAAEASQQLMPQLVDAIVHRTEEQQPQQNEASAPSGIPGEYAPPAAALRPEDRVMPVVQLPDGYGYIGFLSIPSLELELPVMADWSYPQLRKAPCRYTGDSNRDDLVIMAHNYDHHFGRLSQLREGDTVSFTDMDAKTITYEVVALDVLQPEAVDEMTAGDFDLTLFTCTFGGKSRVTVRCMRIQEK